MAGFAVHVDPDGRVVMSPDGHIITGEDESGSAACCCDGETCSIFDLASPRCVPIGTCGTGMLYVCLEIVTNQGRTIRAARQSGVRWFRIGGLCYRFDAMEREMDRAMVEQSRQVCPGAIVTLALVEELGAVDPGPAACQECGCCEVALRTIHPCIPSACCECSAAYDYEESASATVEQRMTAAGLEVFYPAPTPRPPDGVVYSGTYTSTRSGRVLCVDGQKVIEIFTYRKVFEQRSWNPWRDGGTYEVYRFEESFPDVLGGPSPCGKSAFEEAFLALASIEIGSFLRDRPCIGNLSGAAFLETCTTTTGEVQRQFTRPCTVPAQGSYAQHEQQWRNDADCMAASVQGLAIERRFDDGENGPGNFREVWINIANVSASRRFTETQACSDDGPRCDSPGVLRGRDKSSMQLSGADAITAVMLLDDTMQMLRAMGGR